MKVPRGLKPGGRVLIYNICPAPSLPGQPYKSWAEACPFDRAVWESAGFRVVAFDRDDSETIVFRACPGLGSRGVEDGPEE